MSSYWAIEPPPIFRKGIPQGEVNGVNAFPENCEMSLILASHLIRGFHRYGGIMFLPSDNQEYVPSDHAGKRMAQRNISLEDIDFVLDHGQRLHKAGAVFSFWAKAIGKSGKVI